ncbi:molybdate ABC transporter substrate-binding protein [Sphingobium phenoxybenzoativorans]|uniref:Molybdate ABC transporter substrate-binding protein n=1 Tax=Sphingobium phenoxybenzoativorans TaxID=1592790 RepID=A0A975K5M9_9SPHN|nr:molybdate ABC transporter substrate-binding protein [Sphingobium phenoxybenzoativorans]
MFRRLKEILFILALATAQHGMAQTKAPLVLAAASLQESLTKAADMWAAQGHAKPVLSFAASSALARQIQSGAPADMFISADEEWMDAVQQQGKIRAGTRRSFLSNQLVLIAPVTQKGRMAIRPGFPLARALGGGRLAMADPDAVPAGKYGKAALIKLGVWNSVADRTARGESVRAALAMVERGIAPYGIVYTTDARASAKVRIAGLFPPNSHPPITYPIALLKDAPSAEAEGFRQFLLSARGKAIFRSYGFTPR